MNEHDLLQTGLTRDSAFSHHCQRCRRCCHAKRIQVNPYETARMADNRRLSTSAFLRRFVSADSPVLQQREDGACIFLGQRGCLVHRDRPLVCRLYPLGRQLDFSGEERFVRLRPEPGCRAMTGEPGTVAAALEEQGVTPYFAFADHYIRIFLRLLPLLPCPAVSPDNRGQTRSWAENRLVMDVDFALAYDGAIALQPLEARVERHIAILDDWIDAGLPPVSGRGRTP